MHRTDHSRKGHGAALPLLAGGAVLAMTHHGGGHRHGRRGGGRGDFGPGGGFPFGRHEFFRGPGRGRARRGDIRSAILLLLDEEPRNGYQIIQELEARTEGNWRPSAGSVYPALQQLEDEGLVRATETDGRKLFELTDDGRAAVAERPADAPAPWEAMTGDAGDDRHALMQLLRQVAEAAALVARSGSEAQIKEAGRVLTDARKALFGLLADE
jgi:DNA-binding PadR family transcriptional regulator